MPHAYTTTSAATSRERHSYRPVAKTGKFWNTVPSYAASFVENVHFKVAAQMRLGCLQAPDGAVCQMPRAAPCDDKCLKHIENPVVHPHLCKYGPARLRPHRSPVCKMQHMLLKSGAEADVERAIPSLYRIDADGAVKEAILDVVTSLPGSLSMTALDVTIRCPHSSRYDDAWQTPSVAAADGEFEKHERYGQDVVPVALETYGRLGHESQRGLRQLALSAAQRSYGAVATSGYTLYARWRLDLERILLHELADVALLSFGHASGVHASRRNRKASQRSREAA